MYNVKAMSRLYNSLEERLRVLSLPCLHRLSPGNGFQPSRFSSTGIASLLAADYFISHGRNSKPRLASTLYRWLVLTEECLQIARLRAQVKVKPKSKCKSCYDRRLVGQLDLVFSNIWGPGPDWCYCQTVGILSTLGAPSDERIFLPFTTDIVSSTYHL
jgi:hypothetical protein